MKCSFIVSAFNQPDPLISALFSLKMQTETDWECIVCDNSPAISNTTAVAYVADPRIKLIWTGKECKNCYESANFVVPQAKGEYVCFPSCDNYYVPGFLETMLREDADLVYCDFLHDPRNSSGGLNEYRVLDAQLKLGSIDKSGFLLRRKFFQPFPWMRSVDGVNSADGMLIEELVRSGIRTKKAPGVLWVHN